MILTSAPSSIPVFKRGQPLKSSDLNGMLTYFERETFDSRIYLEGAGIFYGLQLAWNGQDTLTINPGVALTSDGYLFAVEKGAAISLNTMNEEPVSVGSLPITGLVLSQTAAGSGSGELKKIMEDENYVIIFLLNKEAETQQECTLSYENSGSRITFSFKVVAVDKNKLTLIDHVSGDQQSPDAPFVHRFGYQQNDVISFDGFTSWSTVQDNFNTICTESETNIETAYINLFAKISALIKLKQAENPFKDLAGRLSSLRDSIISSTYPYWIAYYYDYLRNLVSAWHEVVATTAGRIVDFPDKNRFPGYVVLGSIKSGDKYRTPLYRPPFNDADSQVQTLMQAFIDRMEALTSTCAPKFLDDDIQTAAAISPGGRLSALLSRRVIHFYYHQREMLRTFWDPESVRKARLYPVTGVSAAEDRKLLMQEMDAFGFYHIYGHIGREAGDILNEIKQLRKDLHLPFDIKILFLDTDVADAKLKEEYGASFSDLGRLLEKIIGDLRCIKGCGTELILKIFSNPNSLWDDTNRLQSLSDFFKNSPAPSAADWTIWVSKFCNQNCGSFADCCPAILESMYNIAKEYSARKDELMEGILFSRFAQLHPGIEHNAGVPAGGTLVLLVDKLPSSEKDARNARAMVRGLKELNDNDAVLKIQNNVLAFSAGEVVVADFSLPYICCSKKPSYNIEIKPVVPVAEFNESGREPIVDPETQTLTGYKLNLVNNSFNATKFIWQLIDIGGHQIGDDLVTNSIGDPGSFELFFENSKDYMVKLTALRGTLNSSVTHNFDICPSEDQLLLNYNGTDSHTWVRDEEFIDPTLNAVPFGGQFVLTNNAGEQLDTAGVISWQENQTSVKINLHNEIFVAGVYNLAYGIGDCGRKSFVITMVDRAVAMFTEKQRKPIEAPNPSSSPGWELLLGNNSSNANNFLWEVFDSTGNRASSLTTSNVQDPATIQLRAANGLNFIVKLTASNDFSSDTHEEQFSICPSKEQVRLDWEGKSEFVATPNSTTPLIVNAAPAGGTFSLAGANNTPTPPIPITDFVKIAAAGRFNIMYSILKPGTYVLVYKFQQCDVAKEFAITITQPIGIVAPVDEQAAQSGAGDIEASSSGTPKSRTAESTTPKALFNKRLLRYRTALKKLGQDASLKKLSKFEQTDNLFLTPSVADPGKALQNFGKAYQKLLASFNDAAEKIADEQLDQVAQLLMKATSFYLDKLIAISPQAAPPDAVESVKAGIEVMKQLRALPDMMLQQYNAREIESDENTTTITAYEALFV